MIKRVIFMGEIPCRSAQKTGGLGLSRADARAIHLGNDADCSEPRLKNIGRLLKNWGETKIWL